MSKEFQAERYERAIENLERSITEEPYCVGYGSYSRFVTKETYRQAKQHPLKKLFSFLFS